MQMPIREIYHLPGTYPVRGKHLAVLYLYPHTKSPGSVALNDGDRVITVFSGGPSCLMSTVQITAAIELDALHGWEITIGDEISVEAVSADLTGSPDTASLIV
jgi:hypothetical protein